jgi:hypothetical protein
MPSSGQIGVSGIRAFREQATCFFEGRCSKESTPRQSWGNLLSGLKSKARRLETNLKSVTTGPRLVLIQIDETRSLSGQNGQQEAASAEEALRASISLARQTRSVVRTDPRAK